MKVLVILRLIFWIAFVVVTSILLILKLRQETSLQKKETMWRDSVLIADVARLARRKICFLKTVMGYDVISIIASCLLIGFAVIELVVGNRPWMTSSNISMLWPIIAMFILRVWQHKEYKKDEQALLKEMPVMERDELMTPSPKFTEKEIAEIKEFYKVTHREPDKKN